MKQTKVTSPAHFKQLIMNEFLPTLNSLSPNVRIGYDMKEENYTCQLSATVNQFQQYVYTIYRDANTEYIEYMEGAMGKYPAKDVK